MEIAEPRDDAMLVTSDILFTSMNVGWHVPLRIALSRAETRNHALSSIGLPGSPPTSWVERATIVLDAGFTEDEVMWASGVVGGSWSGAESRHHEEKLAIFQPLLAEKDQRIVNIGVRAVAFLTQRRDEAREREHWAAVKGRLI